MCLEISGVNLMVDVLFLLFSLVQLQVFSCMFSYSERRRGIQPIPYDCPELASV